MMKQLKTEWFLEHPGAILEVRTLTTYGILIQKMLECDFNHDAICCVKNGKAYIGDAEPMFAKLHTIEYYNQLLRSGKITNIQVLLPHDYTYLRGLEAGICWMNDVQGDWYDFLAIYQIFKRLLERKLRLSKIGTEWSWFCTEGVCHSWGCVYWGKDCNRSTPRTTSNRFLEGIFIDFSCEALIEV